VVIRVKCLRFSFLKKDSKVTKKPIRTLENLVFAVCLLKDGMLIFVFFQFAVGF
jgi:hypothetical protein